VTINLDRPEFSRIFHVDRLGSVPVVETIQANQEECVRLAKRLGLVALKQLAASLRIERERGGVLIHVSGRLEADVVQTCVVTLEPFPSHVEDSFSVDFTTDPTLGQNDSEVTIDLDDDPPEAIKGGVIDAGELTAQFLALALDPYPRAPGAALEKVGADRDGAAPLPFAALGKLKLSG